MADIRTESLLSESSPSDLTGILQYITSKIKALPEIEVYVFALMNMPS